MCDNTWMDKQSLTLVLLFFPFSNDKCSKNKIIGNNQHPLMDYKLDLYRAVTDPRDGKRVALKKMPNVFQNLVSSKRVYREIKMLCFFKHENVLSALDILQPPHIDFFQEM